MWFWFSQNQIEGHMCRRNLVCARLNVGCEVASNMCKRKAHMRKLPPIQKGGSFTGETPGETHTKQVGGGGAVLWSKSLRKVLKRMKTKFSSFCFFELLMILFTIFKCFYPTKTIFWAHLQTCAMFYVEILYSWDFFCEILKNRRFCIQQVSSQLGTCEKSGKYVFKPDSDANQWG